jgi:hypothetical protein
MAHSKNIRLAVVIGLMCLVAGALSGVHAEDSPSIKRCVLIPLPGHQVSFRIDGVEKTRWHFGSQYPRPFFYPFNGPSGTSLTRMGHPGAQNHDHHRSVWFAHHKLAGVDFWSDQTEARVQQIHWYAYRDGDDEAVMASKLGWYDGQKKLLMEQDVVAALIPLADGEHALEIQITMRPPANAKSVELAKTNFGFLAVRVAKTLSVQFGGGQITNSEKLVGEKAIFGKQAKWMDYSGKVSAGKGEQRKVVTEGITYFDHPKNPRYPTYWHVRSDGWMGASFGMKESYSITADKPLTLRYLLHAHRGAYDHAAAQKMHKDFAGRAGFEIIKSKKPHRQYEVRRKSAN